MNTRNAAMAVLNGLGWEWYEDGVILTVVLNDRVVRVMVPLRRLAIAFGTALQLPQAVGCVGCSDLCQRIGAAAEDIDSAMYAPSYHAVGGRSRRRRRREKRKARKARRKRRRRKFFRGLGKAVKSVAKAARKVAKGALKVVTSKLARGIVAAVGTAIPVLAPAAAAVAAAQTALTVVQKGIDASKAVQKGNRDPKLRRIIERGMQAKRHVEQQLSAAKRGSIQGQEFAGAIAKLATG